MKKIFIVVILSIISISQGLSQVVINEIFASNINAFFEKSSFNFAGYIEFYNKGTQAVNISGFYLSNKKTDLTLWYLPSNVTIQAKNYYVVYCDELNYNSHTNFRLDADGGKIMLYDKGYQIIDSITYGKQFPDLPFGQKPDGSGKWTRLASPSPKSSNNNIQSGPQICPKPIISPNAGLYNASVTVSIISNLANAQVHYTTNGSEPTIKSPIYTAPFSVSASAIVKAKSFHSEYLPGATSCNSFLINQHKSNLPIVSVSTNPEYLNDDSIGIYVEGKNGVQGNCYGKSNWNRDWERPAVFEYFDASGLLQISQGIDIKIAGACSRAFPQKSLGLLPSSRYGSGNFDYPFFASKPFKTGYGSLMLRNSGNDFFYTMFRDAFEQELCVNQMDIDYQAYQPVAVYLNGNYWGLMNLREKIDKNYLKVNQSQPLDSVIMLEKSGNIILGNNHSYFSFIDSLETVDMSSETGYNLLDRNIDINEYLNYLAVEIFCVNKDWPGNNIKFWKSINKQSKWRWILTDLDFGFGLYNQSPMDSTLYFVTETAGPEWPNPPWSTLLIRKVFENPTTRALFIQKMQTITNTVFESDRVNSKIDSIKAYIAPEMSYHWGKWGGNSADWNANIELMKSFNDSRRKFMNWHIKEFFKLSESHTELSIKNTDKTKAQYFFNQVQINDTLPKEFISDNAIVVESKPLPGYEFNGWDGKKYKNEKMLLIPKGSNWKYFDKGTDKLMDVWRTVEYKDSAWLEGPAELGYGDGDEKTIVEFGGNSLNKIITTAFRKKIYVNDLTNITELKAEIIYDDGAIVYVNGSEAYRVNMPVGAVSALTLANLAKEDDDYYQSFDIPSQLLKTGDNLIAVEIHQSNATSSDISFDLSLSLLTKEPTGTISFPNAKITGSFNESIELTANYKISEPYSDLVINEISASNKLFQDNRGDFEDWIEVYNGSKNSIDLSKIFIEYKGTQGVYSRLYPNDNYILEPGKFIVFWADNETNEGPLHLPFKLYGQAETLKLIQPVGAGLNELDSFKVSTKYSNESMGRYPDGNSNWFRMTTVTPGKANIYYPTEIASLNSDSWVVVYPNPATDFIYVELQDNAKQGFEFTVFGNDGRIINKFSSKSNQERFDISNIPSGAYILKISKGNLNILKKIILIK